MTEGTFSAAIDRIDPAYVSEALNYSGKIKKIKRSTVLKIASVAACFAIVLVSVLAITMRKTPVEGNISTDEFGQEMIVAPVASGKETTGHKIGIKCYSFYPENTINLDVFMSQTYSERETLDGYPVLEIYQETGEKNSVRINGISERFEKKFELDDLKYLGTNSIRNDVFDGYSEKVSLDFSNVEFGQTIKIYFSYGFFYYKGNPYNQSQPDNSWCGMRRSLYFYCGENGVSVGSNSIDEAFSNYEKCNEKLREYWHNPPVRNN
ncbi:MAG: hypothetical protein J6330_00715 [Clostridia bacterium]|nr:hypothetical protein [Clostridia bacterium]